MLVPEAGQSTLPYSGRRVWVMLVLTSISKKWAPLASRWRIIPFKLYFRTPKREWVLQLNLFLYKMIREKKKKWKLSIDLAVLKIFDFVFNYLCSNHSANYTATHRRQTTEYSVYFYLLVLSLNQLIWFSQQSITNNADHSTPSKDNLLSNSTRFQHNLREDTTQFYALKIHHLSDLARLLHKMSKAYDYVIRHKIYFLFLSKFSYNINLADLILPTISTQKSIFPQFIFLSKLP